MSHWRTIGDCLVDHSSARIEVPFLTETVAGAAVPLACTCHTLTKMICSALASSSTALIFVSVEATAVTVDGNLGDWVGVNPVVNDPADTPDTVDILVL
jgi:hypothetical protein